MARLFILHHLITIGSLCGSLFYGVTSAEPSKIRKVAFLIISFVTGVIASDFMAEILSEFTPQSINVEQPLGALVASASAIRLLSLLRKMVERFLNKGEPQKSTNDN
ncbi:hypothetical protein HQN64_23940 [Enterobacteriaceae bacterium BIT-l23]|uniref:putative holin n=1 Tax=Jejubacter sp. L23 TaxID=3092086 RepID=UPI0015854631|nr:hypothetical protein [Enterobacteriaceae bacterium BIT-l23]